MGGVALFDTKNRRAYEKSYKSYGKSYVSLQRTEQTTKSRKTPSHILSRMFFNPLGVVLKDFFVHGLQCGTKCAYSLKSNYL